MVTAKIAILGHGFLGSSIVDGLSGEEHIINVLCRTPPVDFDRAGVYYRVGNVAEHAAIESVVEAGLTVFAIGSTFPVLSKDQLAFFSSQERNLLRIALRATAEKMGHFVYLSSSAVYGEVSSGRACESDLLAPISAYGVHKLSCEQFCIEEAHKLGLPVTILRISNPFGPRQIGKRMQGLIGIVLENLRHGLPTTIRGDGLAVRDYVPVAVLSAVISNLARNKSDIPDILNVCSGEGLSAIDVLAQISAWFDRDVPVEYMPSIAGEIQRSVLDPSRLRDWAQDLPDSDFLAGLVPFNKNIFK